MPDPKRISELSTAATLDGTDLLEIAQVNAGSSSGYASAKITLTALANKIAKGIQFGDLQTTAKDLIDAINEAAVSGGNSNIADDYDNTQTYVVGDYCIYEGDLYKCITAVTSAESFDSTKWDAVLVTDELGQGGGGGASWTDVTGVLSAGQTSITLNSTAIYDNSTFDFYTSKFGVNPTDVELTIQKIKVLRQELVAQESELDVTVTANTYWPGYEPWKAFGNSSLNTGWIGTGGNPHWLQVEFDSATSIREIDFISIDASRSHAISRVGYSNDGTNFEECGIETSTMTNNVGHCELDKDYEAKYFRLYFDGSYATSTYPMVSELEIYGYDDDPQGQKSITLTFDAQSSNLAVKVRITN